MKESIYKHYDELPLFLRTPTDFGVKSLFTSFPTGNSKREAVRLTESNGLSAASYELLNESGFPSLKIGNRIVVPKEQFIQWVQAHTGGSEK